MAQSLLESYKGRIALAEKYYAAKHNGEKLSQEKKLLTAQVLKNTANFINEAYTAGAQGIGVQASDIGMLKQFSMDVTNLVID